MTTIRRRRARFTRRPGSWRVPVALLVGGAGTDDLLAAQFPELHARLAAGDEPGTTDDG